MAAHVTVSPRFEYIVNAKNRTDDTFAFHDHESTDGVISFGNNSLIGLFRDPSSERISDYPDKSLHDFFAGSEM